MVRAKFFHAGQTPPQTKIRLHAAADAFYGGAHVWALWTTGHRGAMNFVGTLDPMYTSDPIDSTDPIARDSAELVSTNDPKDTSNIGSYVLIWTYLFIR